MKIRTFFFTLFLALVASGVNRAAAQAAAQVPARVQAPAQTSTPSRPGQSIVNGNSSNPVTNEAAQTKVLRVYRGEGYFDIALADRLRRTLASNKSAAQKETAVAGRQ
jgi:hypothetical protein